MEENKLTEIIIGKAIEVHKMMLDDYIVVYKLSKDLKFSSVNLFKNSVNLCVTIFYSL